MILKKRGEKIFVVFLLLFSSIITINFILAANANATLDEQNAAICIRESKGIMQSMIDEEFNILSVNDSLKQAEAVFLSQTVLKEKKKTYDFSLVIVYCDNIKTIGEEAIKARDDSNSLLKFYEDSKIPGMNTTNIDLLIDKINEAIETERYSEVPALVEKAYTEITLARSTYTALNVFYEATARGVASFLNARNRILYIPGFIEIKNWHFLLGLFILILILLFIYRIRIMRKILENKLEKLENRRKTIKELVMQTQRDYFQYGKIPEGEYNIKTKRFAELVRDIDRQVPLLKEEIIKLKGGIISLRENKSQNFEELLEKDKLTGFSWKNLFKRKAEIVKSAKSAKRVKTRKSHKIIHKKAKKLEQKKSVKTPP